MKRLELVVEIFRVHVSERQRTQEEIMGRKG